MIDQIGDETVVKIEGTLYFADHLSKLRQVSDLIRFPDKKKRMARYEEDANIRKKRELARGKRWNFHGAYHTIRDRYIFTVEGAIGNKTFHADKGADKGGGTYYKCLGGIFQKEE